MEKKMQKNKAKVVKTTWFIRLFIDNSTVYYYILKTENIIKKSLLKRNILFWHMLLWLFIQHDLFVFFF